MSDLNELSKKIVSRRDAMRKAGVALLGLGLAGLARTKDASACCDPGTCGGHACSGSCEWNCFDQCGDLCTGGCGAECTGSCVGTCTADCWNNCVGSCYMSCYEECNGNCTYTCVGFDESW
jgi:hypothetical protein